MSIEPDRRVDWRELIGGLLLALFTGIFVTFGGFMAGLYIADLMPIKGLAAPISALIPIAIYVPAFLLFRRRMPDFARGLIIGGCIVILVGGMCNLMIVGSMTPGGSELGSGPEIGLTGGGGA